MYTVIIPIVVLMAILFIEDIPYIGGKVQWGLVIAGLLALILGGIYNPIKWIDAWIDGMDRLSWIMALALFGSIYAESQTEIKALDLVLEVLRSAFGKSPKGIITVVILTLGVAGSLLGDAIASATVVGILVVKILYDMDISGEGISAIICMGALLGSIMPPITQAVFLSASLVGVDPTPAVNISYLTIGIGFIIVIIYSIKKFINIEELPEHLIPKKSPMELIKENVKVLLPMMFLIVLVVLHTAFEIDLVYLLIGPIIDKLSEIPIIKGMANNIVTFLIAATLLTLIFKEVRGNFGDVVKRGVSNSTASIKIQIGASLLLGAFYAAGQIDIVREFAVKLEPNVLKIGGSIAMILMAALTGSQSTSQNTIFSFFAPALVEVGVDPNHAVIAGSHIASGGQALPPTSLTALVVCGLVGGILNEEVNPIESMVLCAPFSIYLIAVGILFMYI